MTSAAESPKISVDDYLAGEESSPLKHEYIAGEVFAMAGAGEAHVTVALNLATLLRNHVRKGPCRVYISDMKVRVESADAFYYPDVFVTCDPADGREGLFKRHPTLVIEVLSDSTAAFDRGAKFAHYRQLDSLLEYVLIEPERRSIDVFRRNADGNWVLHPFSGDEELNLASIDFRCPLDAVYEDVDLP
jgi:Uma2 family endonuclease